MVPGLWKNANSEKWHLEEPGKTAYFPGKGYKMIWRYDKVKQTDTGCNFLKFL